MIAPQCGSWMLVVICGASLALRTDMLDCVAERFAQVIPVSIESQGDVLSQHDSSQHNETKNDETKNARQREQPISNPGRIVEEKGTKRPAGAAPGSQQRNDPDFEPSARKPFYGAGKGPLVLIDEAHRNYHTLDGRYQGFAKVLRMDGFRVDRNVSTFTPQSLNKATVLVISNAAGGERSETEQRSSDSAFSDKEIRVIHQWVRGGGSLMLIADHKPFGGAARKLAAALGIQMTDGFVVDEQQPGPIFFRRSDGRLAQHAITDGRGAEERIDHVATFTGQALRTSADFAPLLKLSDSSVLYPDRTGQLPANVEGSSVKGWLQGAAGEIGQGRVAVFGEAGMFSAQLSARNGQAMGMNSPLADQNQQFLLNVMRWLCRGIDQPE